MLITAIEPRRRGLSALYIDGEFAINLDTEILIKNRFDIGKDIDDDMLHDVIIQSDEKRCRDKALWLIQFRDHSRKEIIDKLKKDYDETVVIATVDHLEDLGLINDENYAKRYAVDLINLKRLSKKGAKQKLIQKGIDKELIDEILELIDVDEQEQIKEILNRKYRNVLGDEKGKRRAFNGLVRMGYNFSDIKSVMRDILEENDEL